MNKRVTVPLAAVRIGYETYLLPLADGLKLVQIMAKAAPAQPTFTGRRGRYQLLDPSDRRECELSSIKPDDVIPYVAPAPLAPRQLPAPSRSAP